MLYYGAHDECMNKGQKGVFKSYEANSKIPKGTLAAFSASNFVADFDVRLSITGYVFMILELFYMLVQYSLRHKFPTILTKRVR